MRHVAREGLLLGPYLDILQFLGGFELKALRTRGKKGPLAACRAVASGTPKYREKPVSSTIVYIPLGQSGDKTLYVGKNQPNTKHSPEEGGDRIV